MALAHSANPPHAWAVTVIVASGGERAVRAARAATSTIPIVATIGSDPVEAGYVRSLNRPEGNFTAVSVFAVQLVAKRLELAREFGRDAVAIGFLANPNNANYKIDVREIEVQAHALGGRARTGNEAFCHGLISRHKLGYSTVPTSAVRSNFAISSHRKGFAKEP
jgi:ABC-type uncharacterized transport system substrate-binding protein